MNVRTIKLSKTQAAYLTGARFLPHDLAEIIGSAEKVADGLLTLDPSTAERFRDEFTIRLAKLGFGPGYELTREGELLEDLIDRFAGNT